jgi:alpha-ketoglutarate-dependent taurine dioxygenase
MVAVTPWPTLLGASVAETDIAQLDNRDFNRIHRALYAHAVLGIPGQSLSAGELTGFAQRFGATLPHVLTQYHHPKHPEVLVLSNAFDNGEPRGLADTGSYWHSDYSYLAHPATVTVQYALEIPPEGGDTLFANMYEVYDALPEVLQQRIENLRAIHDYGYRHARLMEQADWLRPLSASQLAATPRALHPVVRAHPETGRKALYVNPGYTVGFDGLEARASDALKEELFDYALRPEFHYHHRWAAGDVLLWDNRCTMHCATRGYTGNRTVYQIIVT